MMIDAKLVAFLSLLVVQIFVSIIYKFSQTKGSYVYSPLSAIASAEFIKLCMSSVALFYTITIDDTITERISIIGRISSRLLACRMLIKKEVNRTFVLYTCGLALFYVINNQLAFTLFLYVDMASISMFKSFSSFVAAMILWMFFERQISREQWASIILQVIGLIIVQYDGCKNMPVLAWKYYFLLLGSTLITAVSSVMNERLIKTYNVNIHIQNSILYSFGFLFNFGLFIFSPDIFNNQNHGSERKHFFYGYSGSVFAIIACNSLLGIIITFVYKYADAIVKTFSTACATGVLLYINVAIFHMKANLVVFLGAIVIFVSSYLFLLVKPNSPTLPTQTESHHIEKIEDGKEVESSKWKCYLISFFLISITIYSSSSFLRHGLVVNFTKNVYLFDKNFMIENEIRIDNISWEQPVIIHGKNLCYSSKHTMINNLTTQIMVHSQHCSPVIICSDTVVTCYLQQGLHKDSLNKTTINISLIKYIPNNSTPIAIINATVPFSQVPSYWETKNVAVIIHFNRPYYERLVFLHIYRDLFPSVFFTGPQAHPGVIECPEGDRGMKAYECLSKVISIHGNNYTGYLMIHFDLLPILYNFQSLNLSSIWTANIACVPLEKATGWYWWDQGMGLRAIKQAMQEIYSNRHNKTSYERFIINYESNAGREHYCSSYSDIFYLPQRYITDWLILSKLLSRNDVFLEIAFPTLTNLIANGQKTSNIEILSGITFGDHFSTAFLSDHPSLHFIHRLDLTIPSQQQLIETVIQKSFHRKDSIKNK